MTKILAIESSCDETAAAVVENGRRVLSNVINTQIALHTRYGGVVPEIASRKHIENINPVIRAALKEASCTLDDIDAVAVTSGPGLVGALLIGVSAAKAIAFATGKPLIGVNHIEGHVCANLIEHPDLEPPFLCLIVSGGHTHLALMKDYGEFEILGRTRDDAAGEAFDKVARAIGLGYPGGPKIEKAALLGDAAAIQFPRGHIAGSPYDFTFSGLKSAVLNYINSEQMAGREVSQANVAASFQAAVVDSIVERAVLAASKFGSDEAREVAPGVTSALCAEALHSEGTVEGAGHASDVGSSASGSAREDRGNGSASEAREGARARAGKDVHGSEDDSYIGSASEAREGRGNGSASEAREDRGDSSASGSAREGRGNGSASEAREGRGNGSSSEAREDRGNGSASGSAREGRGNGSASEAREGRGAELGLDKKPGGELRLVLAGGVAANSYLREKLDAACSAAGIRLYAPRPALCTDNAAMIGAAAYYHYARGARAPLSLNAVPNLKL